MRNPIFPAHFFGQMLVNIADRINGERGNLVAISIQSEMGLRHSFNALYVLKTHAQSNDANI